MFLPTALITWLIAGLEKQYRYLLVLLTCFLFFGIATRSRKSTPDTDNYIDFINFGSSNGGLHDAEYLASKVFEFYSTYLSGELFIFSSTLVPYVLLIHIIDGGKRSAAYFFPILYISTLYGFDLMTNAVRQNIALVFALWILLLNRSHLTKLAILSILAIFHKSILITLFLWIISRKSWPILASMALASGGIIIFISMLSKKFMFSVFLLITDLLTIIIPEVASSPLQKLIIISSLQKEMFTGFAHYFVFIGIIILSVLLYYSSRVAANTWTNSVKIIYSMSCYGVFLISFTSHLIIFYRFFYVIYPLMIYVIYISFRYFHFKIKIISVLLCIISLITVLTRRSMSEFALYAFYS